ncbi:hypothetical protein J3F84DRAFT_346752 [Trichoderma pleuroticola]
MSSVGESSVGESPVGDPVVERGMSIPRIVRDNGFCLTCRRSGKQCDSTLPICHTCQEDGLECVQPISAYPGVETDSKKRGRNSPGPEEERSKARLRSASGVAVETPAESGFESGFESDSEGETQILTPSSPQSEAETEILTLSTPQSNPEAEILTLSTPQSEAETEILTPSTTQSKAEAGISTPPAPEPQSESAHQTQPQPQSQLPLQVNENDENSAPGHEFSSFINTIRREIDQAQQRVLRQTRGHVPFSAVLDQHNGDPDHDYAVFYDYQYDPDPDVNLGSGSGYDSDSDSDSDDDHGVNITVDNDVGGPNEDGSQNATLATSQPTAPAPVVIVFQMRNTWTGQGTPPLGVSIRDFITYMDDFHLSHITSDALPLSLLPACKPTTAETLRYYVLRPINRGTRLLADINPTNPKLVDLAYSNPLVLQLIIAERANHREVSSARLPTGEAAEAFHRSAIGAFALKIRGYLAGNEEDMLPLTMGGLILSLTETARLDRRGQAPDYPQAAARILIMLTTLPHEEVCNNLPYVLVEYYMHTAMFACLAADITAADTIPFVSDAFQDVVDRMVARNYHGMLCGTWLPIMVSIHDIFTLGMSMRPYGNGPLSVPSPGPSTGHLADHFFTFGRIQEQLFHFIPALDESSPHFEAGVLWRNAALLYLWSLLEWPHTAKPAGPYSDMIRNTFDDALRQLGQIGKEDSVNKTISWPLLVVGCFAMERGDQDFIASRLIDSSARFKVGNALETCVILRHVWAQPVAWRSPWLLRRSIRATKSWGSREPNRLL